MPERKEGPIIPEPQIITPEEQARIEESGREFEAQRQAALASREPKRQSEGRPGNIKQPKVAGMDGQKARIIRAKLKRIAGSEPVEQKPEDFAQSLEVENDDWAVAKGRMSRMFEKFTKLFKRD